MSHAKFHCNKLITIQDIQDYESLIFLAHSAIGLQLELISMTLNDIEQPERTTITFIRSTLCIITEVYEESVDPYYQRQKDRRGSVG